MSQRPRGTGRHSKPRSNIQNNKASIAPEVTNGVTHLGFNGLAQAEAKKMEQELRGKANPASH